MKYLLPLALIFLSTSIFAIDSLKCDQIYLLMDGKKWDEAKSEIDAVKDLDDPEYYALLLNYYFGKAESSSISIVTDPPMGDESSPSFTDSTGQKYYLAANPSYDTTLIAEGLELFKPSLEKFPSRLDLQFGYVFAAQQFGYYEDAESCMMNILKISKEINNGWLWSYNAPLPNAEASMLSQTQAMVYRLFRAEKPEADSVILRVSGRMMELYPESAYGYNNIGSLYNMKSSYDKALVYFLKAYKAAPNDALVMANLADTYLMLENYDTAIYYLNKIVETGDEELAPWAKDVLKEIGNAAQSDEMY